MGVEGVMGVVEGLMGVVGVVGGVMGVEGDCRCYPYRFPEPLTGQRQGMSSLTPELQ